MKRVTLAFALDEPDAAASGRHACILGASGLTLISASDAPPKTALISESPLASRGSGAQARPGRPAQGMLSCAQMMPMRACGGDHCDGSLPFYFADAFVSAGNLARVDGGARDWCPREWLYLLRHCQIGAPAGSQATGGGVEGDNVVKGVSWRMGETRNVAVAHHVPLEVRANVIWFCTPSPLYVSLFTYTNVCAWRTTAQNSHFLCCAETVNPRRSSPERLKPQEDSGAGLSDRGRSDKFQRHRDAAPAHRGVWACGRGGAAGVGRVFGTGEFRCKVHPDVSWRLGCRYPALQ